MSGFACPSFDAVTRRTLLRAGGMGLLGMTMPKLLQGAATHAFADAEMYQRPKLRAKQCIFLFQWGGPSHLETVDMKPEAASEYRGPHEAMLSSNREVLINRRLPQVSAIMDKCTVIRSVHHKMTNHNSAGYYALTGVAPPSDDQRLRDTVDLFPAYGSIVHHCDSRLGRRDPAMPGFVSYPHRIADGSITPGQHASFLGKRHDPLFIPREPSEPDFGLPELSLPKGVSMDRLLARRGLMQLIDRQSKLMESSAEARGIDAYYEEAMAMLNSTRVREAFDLSREPQHLKERYGPSAYGQGCLLARRLAESGVRFTTVFFSESIGGQSMTEGGWDTHGFNNTQMYPIIEQYHLPMFDQTFPALIHDLESRGMLDDTLVVWMGEFGRTPKINKNASRDHWPQCYSIILAGGGVKRGFVYGKSDAKGEQPAEAPVTPDDVSATIFHLMGINPNMEVHDTQGRPMAISRGQVINEVIA